MNEYLLKQLEKRVGYDKIEELEEDLWVVDMYTCCGYKASIYFDEIIEQGFNILSLRMNGEHIVDIEGC